MVKAMNEKEGFEELQPRLDGNGKYDNWQLRNFVTKNTRSFFTMLSLPTSFLELSPQKWKQNEDFLEAEKTVHSLKVINDTAERGVQLIQEYNSILTKNEDQKQFLLQVVREHRKIFPDSKKSTTIADINYFLNQSKRSDRKQFF